MKVENGIEREGLVFSQVKTEGITLDVLTSQGPRILGIYHKGSDDNPLFVDQRGEGGLWKIARGPWPIVGGTRIWVHQGEETEMSYIPDTDPCVVEQDASGAIRFTSAVASPYQIVKGFEIKCIGAKTFGITAFARNVGDMIAAMGLWELTCFKQKGVIYHIPIGGGEGFQTFTETIYLSWAGHSSQVLDYQFDYQEDGVVMIDPDGKEAKHAYVVPLGFTWCVFPEVGYTLVKIFPWLPERWAAYPGGHNAAVYISPGDVGGSDGGFFESEVMGPLELVQPGAEITLQETWVFLDGIITAKGTIMKALKEHWLR